MFKRHRDQIIKIPCLNLPWENLDWLKNIKLGKKFKTICVVGMGGSSLGAKALIKGVKCPVQPRFAGQLRLLDNIDPNFVNDTLAQIDLKKTLFLLISKSAKPLKLFPC